MPRTPGPAHPSDSSVTFAEYFAGMGLVRLGIERARPGWRCLFANDLDPDKRDLYEHHFNDRPDGTDIHQLPAERVPPTDLATASFPCTDLSLAGGRGGLRRGESSAFWGFHRLLREQGEARPRAVLLENVVGLLTSHNGRDFLDLLTAMNDLGYRVDPVVLDARWFVPQSRPRLFVACLRDEIASTTPVMTPATLRTSRVRPERLAAFIRRHADDIDWSIGALPDPPDASARTLTDILRDPPPDDPAWWSRERVTYLLDQMFDRHRAWIDERLHQRALAYATAFRRVRAVGDGAKRSMAELRTDGIAGCLRTPKGGSARQILVRAGFGEVHARLLSARECAALMGAETFALDCSETRALFGFGDAVCVDAVAWLTRHRLAPVLETRPVVRPGTKPCARARA